MKTTAHARMVQPQLNRIGEALAFNLRAVNRVEFGFYGVRVWRL